MAILPISSVNLRNNSRVNFTHKNDMESAPVDSGMIAPLGKTVPVVVLMAMNPSLLNAGAAINEMSSKETNPNTISMVIPTQTEEADPSTYVIKPEVEEVQQTPQKTRNPYGWRYFDHYAINEVHHGHEPMGDFDMLYIHSPNSESENVVSGVYIVRGKRDIPVNTVYHPPKVKALIYHNIGKDKEFCGVLTTEDLVKEDGNTRYGRLEREYRLDNETAQKLIYLINDRTKWNNYTGIKIIETNTSQYHPAKRY